MNKMKTCLLLTLLLCTSVVWGGEKAHETQKSDSGYEFVYLTIVPGTPSNAYEVPVIGVKVGAPLSFGAPVIGVDAAVFCAGTDSVQGVQCSLIMTDAEEVGGLQFALGNFAKRCKGLQLGIFNYAEESSALQIGILNYNPDGFLKWFPFFNF